MMEDKRYLRAALEDISFAVPAAAIVKIVADSPAVPVPDALEGICGILREEREVFAIRSLLPGRKRPARLAVLCQDGEKRIAYAADSVAAMDILNEEEAAEAIPAGTGGVLLLSKKDSHDCT